MNIVKKNVSSIKNMIKNNSLVTNKLDLVIIIVSLIIILLDYEIPNELASILDNNVIKVVLYLCVLSLFMYVTPITGILALIALNTLVNSASIITGSSYLHEINNSEQTKTEYINSLDHNNEVTLEEEMVEVRAPLVRNEPVVNANYKPVLEETHNASNLSENDL